MNKLKKIGLSALAGSLAMTTANAVDYVVAGDAAMNYTSETSNASKGNGDAFSLDTSLYFDASGSLDNGWDVSFSMDWDNESGTVANTSTQAAVTMGSMGTIQINQIGGSAANAIDDVTPSAYEEAYGMGGLADGTGATGAARAAGDAGFFGSSTNSGSIQYTLPALEASGATVSASIGFDPASNTDGASFNGTQGGETGMFYVLRVKHESGLEVGAGLEDIKSERVGLAAAGQDAKDEESVTAFAKYAMGPVSVGYQESYQDSIDGKADLEANMWSIAYTAGDMSISYGETEAITKGASAVAERTTDADAIAVSYSMGSMTIQAQRSEQSRTVAGTAGSTDLDETGIKVSFAF
jgi:outer membrane protein OmpU